MAECSVNAANFPLPLVQQSVPCAHQSFDCHLKRLRLPFQSCASLVSAFGVVVAIVVAALLVAQMVTLSAASPPPPPPLPELGDALLLGDPPLQQAEGVSPHHKHQSRMNQRLKKQQQHQKRALNVSEQKQQQLQPQTTTTTLTTTDSAGKLRNKTSRKRRTERPPFDTTDKLIMGSHAGSFVTGVSANCVVLIVFGCLIQASDVTSTLLLNLAVADFCYLMFLPLLIQTEYIGYWIYGTPLCKVYMTMSCVTQFTSSLFVMLNGADRYYLVCHPIDAQRRRKVASARLVSACAWLTGFAMMIPVTIYSQANTNFGSCRIVWPKTTFLTGDILFAIYSFSFSFLMPFSVLAICYLRVILALQRGGPATLANRAPSVGRRRVTSKAKILFVTLLIVYLTCWIFHWTAQLYLCFSRDTSEFVKNFVLLASCASYANPTLNPFLYAFSSRDFFSNARRSLRNLFSRHAS